MIGGPLDGQMMTVEGWRDLDPDSKRAYIGFNRSGYSHHTSPKTSFTMVWVHHSLISKFL